MFGGVEGRMKNIFAGLSLWAGVFLLTTIVLGYQASSGTSLSWHIKAGLFTAVFFVLLHCLVFVHLLGTGLGVKRAAFEHKLEEGPIVRRLWALKMRAFPPAFFCMALVIMLAVAGGAVQSQVLPVSVHRWLAYIVLGLNLVTIPIEVKVMGDNLALMEEVESRIAAGEGAVRSAVGVGTDPSAA